MSRREARDPAAGPTAVELVEESVHLLRTAAPGTMLVYYAGSIPFTLGLLFFWAHTTWFAPTGVELAWSALGLTVLFGAMKAAHADFCARLLAQRLGASSRTRDGRGWARLAADSFRVQAFGLVILPLSLLAGVPFGWVYAYFQNLSVLADEADATTVARSQAALWPGQNHLGLLIFFGLALCAWINLAGALWMVPWFANRVLGIENVFGLSGRWFLNTTSLASVTMLTWLAVDPLSKAFYTLRVFHGRARRTGEDVRADLHAARPSGRALAAVMLLMLAGSMVPGLRAAEAVAPVPSKISAGRLDQAIEHTLAGRNFQWRLRPVPVIRPASGDGPIYRFIQAGADWVVEAARTVGRAIGRAFKWFSDLFRSSAPPAAPSDSGVSGAVLGDLMIVISIAIGAGLLTWVGMAVWKRARETRAPTLNARLTAVPVPDLNDENTQAAQLPTDGWLALAREQMARGEWRLALRALHLAMLARLAAEGWVSLAKFKTNLDYERELRRRAVARGELPERFAQRRRFFEAAWYGRAEPAESEARAWLAELEPGSKP
ncbi:MAG: hypothetical protein JWM32_2181 [Verrucomicrobia bacterium]|nr:hypothetical protein [Verrucomicrobiota bacterium]